MSVKVGTGLNKQNIRKSKIWQNQEFREKWRDQIKSYDKNPFTNRKI